MIEQEDAIAERILKVHRDVEKDLACYKVLHEEKKAAVQLKLDKLFSKVEKLTLSWKEWVFTSAKPHNLFHWVCILL